MEAGAESVANASIIPEVWMRHFDRVVYPLAICALYICVGPTLILVNNHIMNEHFDYPILLSMMGVTASAVLARVLVFTGYATLSEENAAVMKGADYWRRALPVGLCYALTLSGGNTSYLYLDVSFIQMFKCFTPVIVLLVLIVTGVEKPGKGIIWAVVAITIGTLINTNHVHSDGKYSFFGIVLLLGSSTCEAIRLVLTQHLLSNCKFTVVEGQYFLSPAGAGCMLFMALCSEVPHAARSGKLAVIGEQSQLFIISCVLGIAANFLGFIVIQRVGSLTLKVLAIFRSVALVVYAVVFLHEQLTMGQAVGYGISLTGFGAYTYLRSKGGATAGAGAAGAAGSAGSGAAAPSAAQPPSPQEADEELEGLLVSGSKK